jgi:hypothetical protein
MTKFTLASVAEVRVALVTLIALAYVAADAEALAGAVTAMARGGAQIIWARCVPRTSLIWPWHRASRRDGPFLQLVPKVEAQDRDHQWGIDVVEPRQAHGGVIEGDVHDLEPLSEEQQRRLEACVAGEAERLPKVAARVDAEGVGHAHAAAGGAAVGTKPHPQLGLGCGVCVSVGVGDHRRRHHQEERPPPTPTGQQYCHSSS